MPFRTVLKIPDDLEDFYDEIESNSLEVVNLIRNRDSSEHKLRVIVDNIRQVLSRNNLIRIKHIFKEKCVDSCGFFLALFMRKFSFISFGILVS